MASQKKTLTEIFSYTTIGLSLALMSGLALGHVTEQSMHPRLSTPPPVDPVERYALGQNAYKMSHVPARTTRTPSPEYADASYEIGRYEKGARVLTPQEPARKIGRLRLERLQAWHAQSFDPDEKRFDEGNSEYVHASIEEDAPIDLGAVQPAPESAGKYTGRAVAKHNDSL